MAGRAGKMSKGKRMTKDEIITELYVTHNVWEAGYSRSQLEQMSKKELKEWLEDLQEAGIY